MPPLPALHLKALDDLAKQLRFAPVEAARRQLERAEELFDVVIPAQTYPEDWIVFAITGYRPEIASPALVVGGALLRDLGILVERLSDAAELTENDLPGLRDSTPQWLDAAQLCERWSVSRKTLDRYRRQTGKGDDGATLPARRVRGSVGRDKLYFALKFVRKFETARADSLTNARSFSRLDADVEAKIVRLAAKYRERLGWSLNRTAERLADRFGRGHETIRQLLKRHNQQPGDNGVEAPVFTERGPLSDRERRVVVRAYARGVEVEALADHFKRTRQSIYRVLSRERADALRSIKLVDAESPVIPRPEDVMRAPSVRTGLGRAAPATLAHMLAEAEADPLPDPRAERHRSSAYWRLRAEAAALIAELPPHNATAGACDEIETRLRWASRLKAELVRSQLSLMFKTIKSALGREITALPRPAASSLLTACIDALIEGTAQFDPTKGGRLAAPVGIALNRAVVRWAKPGQVGVDAAGGRAVAFADPASVLIDDWTRRVDPWLAHLDPDRRVRPMLSAIAPDHARFLAARFCWADSLPGAEPPKTIAALAPGFDLTHHHASARERDAIVAALRAARAGMKTPEPRP